MKANNWFIRILQLLVFSVSFVSCGYLDDYNTQVLTAENKGVDIDAYAPYNHSTKTGYYCNNLYPNDKVIKNSYSFSQNKNTDNSIIGSWKVIDGWEYIAPNNQTINKSNLFSSNTSVDGFIYNDKPYLDSIYVEPVITCTSDYKEIDGIYQQVMTCTTIPGYYKQITRFTHKPLPIIKDSTILYISDDAFYDTKYPDITTSISVIDNYRLNSKFKTLRLNNNSGMVLIIVDISADFNQMLIQTPNTTTNDYQTVYRKYLLQKE